MSVTLRYIGKKSLHTDTSGFSTGAIWHGHGDDQVIDDERAGRRLAELHPDVYRVIEPGEEHIATVRQESGISRDIASDIVLDVEGRSVPLSQAPFKAILDYATNTLGLNIPANADMSRSKLLSMVLMYDSQDKAYADAREVPPLKLVGSVRPKPEGVSDTGQSIPSAPPKPPAPKDGEADPALVGYLSPLKAKPKLTAVSAALGRKVSGKERDEVWAAIEHVRSEHAEKVSSENLDDL